MMEYEITRLPDECHTKVTVKYGNRKTDFTFLHHENCKMDSLAECFSYILNSAAMWEWSFTAKDYLEDNFYSPYTDEQIATAQYEAGLWQECWEHLHFLFDDETIDLIENLVGGI